MPIVSINLSPRAYAIYDYLAKGRRASRLISTLLVNWDNMPTYERSRTEGFVGPMLEVGDMRTMSNGDVCYWTDLGWKPTETIQVVEE